MKIREKINLIVVNGLLLIILVTAIVINIFSSNQLRKLNENSITISNENKSSQILTFLNDKEVNSEILAAASVYRDFLKEPKNSSQYSVVKEKIDKRLDRTIEIDKNILEIYILDKNGKVLASSEEYEEGEDKSNESYYINFKGSTYISDPYFYEDYKKIVYSIISPVEDDDKQVIGFSVLVYSADDLYKIIGGNLIGTSTGENFIVNSDLVLISPSRFLSDKDLLNKKIETQNARECFDPEEKRIAELNDDNKRPALRQYIDYRNKNIMGTHHYIATTDWCLITKQDMSEVMSPSLYLTIIIILVSIAALSIFIPILYYITSRIIKSISDFHQEVASAEKGDFNRKIIIKTGDEVEDLSLTFNKMLESLKKSREEVDIKVEEQTKEIKEKEKSLEEQQRATLNVLEDVESERKKTELLAHDLEKFKLAVENASDHIVITNPEGIIIFANKSVERITGFSPKEIVGQKAGSKQNWGGWMDINVYKKLWNTIKVEKKIFTGELNNQRKGGDKYEVLASIAPVLDKDGSILFFIGIERDITKEKEIDKAKTEFVSLASHQLRTPLSSINWYTEMLLAGDAGKINEEQEKYLKEVYAGNKRMVELVNALLNVSRLDLGTFIIEPEPTDVIEMAKSLLSELTPTIKEKALKVKENYDKDIPRFNADSKLLRIVFQNLLSNAVKYTLPKGDVGIQINILKKGAAVDGKKLNQDSLTIVVSDSGMGIPSNQKDKIFSKLFRADNARESEAEGTGLGLYIVKSIVDQSGGEIWFESEEKKGTTFYVTFPLSGMKKKEGSKKLDI